MRWLRRITEWITNTNQEPVPLVTPTQDTGPRPSTMPPERQTTAEPTPHEEVQNAVAALKDLSECISPTQHRVAHAFAAALGQIIDPSHLTLGGGTVLAARWGHRESYDVDLFCRPEPYGQLGRHGREQIETSVKNIPGCDQQATWCEDIATYTEINGIEATVLPRGQAFETQHSTMLRGTRLRMQSTAEILYLKIMRRMYEAEEISVRDVYDVGCATLHDPRALDQALNHMHPDIVEDVRTTIGNLPKGWSNDDDKPLKAARYAWSEQELQERAREALTPGGARQEGRER